MIRSWHQRLNSVERVVGCSMWLAAAGCGLLEVGNDPTVVEERDVANVEGALMQRRAAIYAFRSATAYEVRYAGVLADEFFYDTRSSSVNGEMLLDRRESAEFEAAGGSRYVFSLWPTARVEAGRAIARLRAFMPQTPLVGEMFAIRGLATVQLAEDYCPGFALNEVIDDRPVYGAALTTDQVFEAAVTEFDSALTHAADSARILNLVRVGRARALLGLGRFSEAAASVAAVPIAFVQNTEFLENANVYEPNQLYGEMMGQWLSVANREGSTGLDFVTASDPRVGTVQEGYAFDERTPVYRATKYGSSTAPITVASGIEARLIQAEAALAAANPDWLTILNDLRATQITPALPALADPGTNSTRVNLLFRERAFWLFATGHRLGDLRRLIARYQRAPNSVFPAGAYWRGDDYATGTSIPFPATTESVNPAVTGCSSR
jgi:hypothetical protein